jgi:hypothetical protein
VFPQRTSYTPDDDYVFIGMPPLFLIPEHDEVHISCVFTWDIERCEELKYQWELYTDRPVKLGGVAFGSQNDTFTPELYVKKGITFTSRGCNNKCTYCEVHKREGKLKELPITSGNIIQDNNFLQTSHEHKEAVFKMLSHEKQVCFKGGLQADLIDEHFINNIKKLSIKELWLSCDTARAIPQFIKAVERLISAGYTRSHIRCYVLIGDDMGANEDRLQSVYRAGAMPFAQLYQPCAGTKIEYNKEWKKFHRQWSRPAAIKAHCEHGTKYSDYNT